MDLDQDILVLFGLLLVGYVCLGIVLYCIVKWYHISELVCKIQRLQLEQELKSHNTSASSIKYVANKEYVTNKLFVGNQVFIGNHVFVQKMS